MLHRTLSILAALVVSLCSAAPGRAQAIAGQWIGADSAVFVRVEMNIVPRSGGKWAGHVAYTDTRTGRLICRTPVRFPSNAGSPFEVTEVLCGGGVLGLVHEGRQMQFRRGATSARPGGISNVVLQHSGPAFTQPIQLGEIVRGRLESGDPVGSNDTFQDDYTFTAPAAMTLRITMRATGFGPYLWVVYGSPAQLKAIGNNDARGRTPATVTVDVPAGDQVRITANASEKGMQGAYTLQVTAN
ncbi:MAG TPA: hypothetical protein VEX86_02765 [Longimicrobium sp.]|nr:hypothetical protein [Longimicrobium sp.]